MINNIYRNKSLKKLHFILSLIGKVGGFWVFVGKIVLVFKRSGLKGALEKFRYIHLHSTLFTTDRLVHKDYNQWLKKFWALDSQMITAMRERLQNFEFKPLISVILPTYNSNPKWLEEAIESVRKQIYPHWELCIADDASTKIETIDLLRNYQKTDSRIKVVFRETNGHISLASNSALEIAKGDFVAFLDHDDKLPVDALFWVVHTINKNPDAALIYSDEDKIDQNGVRQDPYFKCDWNHSLFLAQNMISHLGVYLTSVVKEISGFRAGYEGSQDYDLALRFIEKIRKEQIIHIPRILYHWRIHKNSTAQDAAAKPYAVLASQKAIAEHLFRLNIRADVEIQHLNMLRVKYYLGEKHPLVSIIIPSRNNYQLLEKCINTLLTKSLYTNFEVLIIDNNSDDPKTIKYLDEIKNMPKIKVLSYKKPFNFSAINNYAVSESRGEFLCLLNDDTEIINEDWLNEMVSIGQQDGVGVVGAKLYYPDGRLQHVGVILGIGGVAGHVHKLSDKSEFGYFGRLTVMHELSAVTGACMLVRKDVFIKVGGFDEVNLPVAFNDIDLCLKIRDMGYKIIWTPFAELIHYESVSRGDDFEPQKIKRFQSEIRFMLEKWGEILFSDPAYSPHLNLEKGDFSLAWPPRLCNVID